MTKFSELPAADNLSGSEIVAVVQGGTSKRTTAVAIGQSLGALIASNNLSDVPSDADARANIGLGTIATQNANNVALTGGSITGITDLAIADGGTGASTASDARTNLGLGTAATQNLGDFVYVASLSDLPTPSAGVITLGANKTYIFTNNLDLAGNRLVASQNTTLLGGSSENCIISSTGLDSGTALLSSAYSIPIRYMAFTHGTVLALDATGNSDQAIDWFGVNFIDCATIGTIANYSNAIFTSLAFLNSGGMTFDGSTDTIAFEQCLFNTPAGGTAITIPATATITRRFRIIYSSFVTLAGETGLNVSTSATIPDEGYILDTVNFSGGGTYTTGVAFDDNKSLWQNNRGVTNSAAVGHMTMSGNATATTISQTGTPVKVAGTTVEQDVTQKFTHTSNRLTYTGALTQFFFISAVASFSAGNNNVIGTYIAKNGTVVGNSEIYATANAAGRAENVAVQTVVSMATGDYLELFVENDTATTNITVSDMSFIVRGI